MRSGTPAGMLPQRRSEFAKKGIEEHTDVKFAYLHLDPVWSPKVLDRISFHRLLDDRKNGYGLEGKAEKDDHQKHSSSF